MKDKKMIFVIAIFLIWTFFVSTASAATVQSFTGVSSSASYSQYQYRPSFQTYYGSNVQTYWPILGDRATCEARQDLLLNVAPAGCQPAVVRSDLLADQNVPVFCQIDALKINPLIDISQIRNIAFRGNYPPEIIGAGFHPAQAALRTHDRLLGKPLINNVGYVVLVLRRQPDESKLPDIVNVTLEAELQYVSGNAYGIGSADFALEPLTDEEWASRKYKQSFWNGRYFVRLERADANFAYVSIYEGVRKINTVRVEKGKTSNKFFMPGMYCRAGLQVAYDDYVIAKDKATIEVSSDAGADVFDVYDGSKFLDGRCTVKTVKIDDNGETGKVTGSCQGKNFELKLLVAGNNTYNVFLVNGKAKEPEKNENEGYYKIDLTELKEPGRKGIYYLEKNDELTKVPTDKTKKEGFIAVNSSGAVNNSIAKGNIDWILQLWSAMKEYRDKKANDASYSIGELKNRDIAEAKTYYDSATQNYEKVADDFPAEKKSDIENAFYGEEALRYAIQLSKDAGAKKDEARLINKYLDIYGNSDFADGYKQELNNLYKIDSSNAAEVFEFDDRARTIRVVRFDKPQQEAKATFLVGGKKFIIGTNGSIDLNDNNRVVGYMKIESLKVDRVDVKAVCDLSKNSTKRYSFAVDGKTQQVCDLINVELEDITAGQVARIRLLPYAERTQTRTNITVGVGIEKRAIKLTPDKALEKIENLNKSIEKWEKISDKLGNVVTGLKGACFATSGLLTFKNLISGFSGETIARQQVMAVWKKECEKLVPDKYPTMNACYLGEASKIDGDVATTTAAITGVNTKINEIQRNHQTSSGIFGQSVDSEAVRKELAEEARRKYGAVEIATSNLRNAWKGTDGKPLKKITVEQLLSKENIERGVVTTEDIKQVMLYAELQNKQGLSGTFNGGLNDRFMQIAERVNEVKLINEDLQNAKAYEDRGMPGPVYIESEKRQTRYADIRDIGKISDKLSPSKSISHFTTVRVPSFIAKDAHGQATGTEFKDGAYVMGLERGDARSGIYSAREVWLEESDGKGGYKYTKLDEKTASLFKDAYQIGNFESKESISYNNEISSKDKFVRYYETEPYKGMPAIVPFDLRNGWYAATKQTLPVFGGIGAFDASGRVTSYWICNVGKNGRIEFETGFGDDLCQQINLNTGQPLGVFPGLNEQQARSLITKGSRCIEDAANKYGSGKVVNICGNNLEVGSPATGKPGTQCQDFMSPRDCHLLFNVCDPVICPASRCDLGGQFPVANVPQTGIIGSIFLCLPNIREGIAMPVCLTGIQAGIDGFVSIMKNYRDCLQENVDTGRMVGVCDQIYSVYLCDFFWNQVAPFVNVIVPKIIEVAYGQGVRGGGEYLTVQASWQNMQNSINYFTQSYAVNSLQAFQVRSEGKFGYPLSPNNAIAEIGGQFCKSFISAKAPAAFKSLIKPDSPPQFHAWFDSTRYSDATVPATARYKVFYHIFAGKDSGVYFDVYLKNPPESSYYSTAPYVQVASSYIPAGEYASDTKDFTAPEGYKELCVRVNAQEECGFKQVSTSFVVDYLRDMYMKDQMTRTDITSERECIGGSSTPYTLLNPNLQSGVQETISPQIYNRGVVRICASQNPGRGINEARFVNAGYCDDPKMICWLDKTSVTNAITANNLGVQNETLQALEQRMFSLLAENGTLLELGEAVAQINGLEDEIAKLEKSSTIESDAQAILRKASELESKLFYNNHKAWLLLLKGRTNEIVTRYSLAREGEKKSNELKKQEVVGPQTLEGEINWIDAFDYTGRDFKDVAVLVRYLKEKERVKIKLNGEEHYIGVVLLEKDYATIEVSSTRQRAGLEVGETRKFDFNDNNEYDLAVKLSAVSDGKATIEISYLKESVKGGEQLPAIFKGAKPEYDSDGNLFIKWLLPNGNPTFRRVTKSNEYQYLVDGKTWVKLEDVKNDELELKNALVEYENKHPFGETNTKKVEEKECVLTEATWTDENRKIIESAEEGEEIFIQVKGNNCDGKKISVAIKEEDIIIDDKIDNFVMSSSADGLRTGWRARWQCDGEIFGRCLSKEPTFYFVAKLADKDKEIRSGLLKVMRKTEENGESEKEYYSLKEDEKLGDVERIYLDGRPLEPAIFFRLDAIYVKEIKSENIIGALSGGAANKRISIPDYLINNLKDKLGLRTEFVELLKFLNGKRYSELKKEPGILCEEEKVQNCGAGQVEVLK